MNLLKSIVVLAFIITMASVVLSCKELSFLDQKNFTKTSARVGAGHLSAAFYWQWPGVWVLAFIAIYAVTLGPVTWVALSEIFPNRIRGNAVALAALALWITTFFTTASFPVMKQLLGLPITFGFYAILCFIYFLFIRIRMPETKGKSLEEIETLLTK